MGKFQHLTKQRVILLLLAVIVHLVVERLELGPLGASVEALTFGVALGLVLWPPSVWAARWWLLPVLAAVAGAIMWVYDAGEVGTFGVFAAAAVVAIAVLTFARFGRREVAKSR